MCLFCVSTLSAQSSLPIIVDTDAGADDIIALAYLLSSRDARIAVSANLQRMDVKPESSRKSAYDYGMFNKGEI